MEIIGSTETDLEHKCINVARVSHLMDKLYRTQSSDEVDQMPEMHRKVHNLMDRVTGNSNLVHMKCSQKKIHARDEDFRHVVVSQTIIQSNYLHYRAIVIVRIKRRDAN